jgi:phage/plasmid-associated DNA primase
MSEAIPTDIERENLIDKQILDELAGVEKTPEFQEAYTEYSTTFPELFPEEVSMARKYHLFSKVWTGYVERASRINEFQIQEKQSRRDVFNAEIHQRLHTEYINTGGVDKYVNKGKNGEVVSAKVGKVSFLIHKVMNTVSFNNVVFFYDHISGIYREDKGQVKAAVRVFCSFIGNFDLVNPVSSSVELQLKSYKVFTEYPFNTRKNLIPVKNGTLHLIPTMKGYAFKLRDMSFTDMTTWRIPIKYNEASTLHKEKVVELFKQWVDSDTAQTLIRIPAQAIRQASLELPFKRSYLLVGAKDAGKTTYLALLYQMFEDLYSQVPMQQVGSQFKSGEMEGKLLNIKDELSDAEMKNLNQYKDFVGSSRHQIERKGIQGYAGRISSVHVYACNTPPKLSNPNDIALLSRWEIVIFPNTFDRIPGWVERTITEELKEGFLLLVVDEVSKIIDTGLPEVDEEEVKLIWTKRASPDEVAFIVAMLEKDPSGIIPRDECYQMYHEYMLSQKKTPKGKEGLGTALSHLEIYSSRPRIEGVRTYCYTGIRKRGLYTKPDKDVEQKQL